jgi:hypothetical protein
MACASLLVFTSHNRTVLYKKEIRKEGERRCGKGGTLRAMPRLSVRCPPRSKPAPKLFIPPQKDIKSLKEEFA